MIIALVFGGVIMVQAQEQIINKQAIHSKKESVKKVPAKTLNVQKEQEAKKAELQYAEIQKAQTKNNFKELNASSISSSLKDAIAKRYNGSTISKAFVNPEKTVYKVLILNKSAESGIRTVFLNASEL